MIPVNDILDAVDSIARSFPAARVILFGSYAWGEASTDSDVDVLVVMPYRGASYRAASRIRIALDVTFAMDILVRSQSELERRLKLGDAFLREIMDRGIVLHDSNDERMGQQGRRRLRNRLVPSALAKA